ncbi:MAG: capsular biosynthesis protein [Microscillaceae bacterium]|nr:capsular biosynthesis protein [Microscillaceae bacterium]MDW8460868.1 CpsB/CapC family capsule biosynthesis tyrosine phosphatase [Cytophagales bacterium]
MFSYLFKRNKREDQPQEKSISTTSFSWQKDAFITTDVHSHLLPGIDDGSKTLEESLTLIKNLQALGYKKVITTPHVMGDAYRNTPEVILGKLAELRAYLAENQTDIEIEAAAEYYLDAWFMDKLANNEKLLTFGKKYLLFETGFLNKPQMFFTQIFKIQSEGYIPVFAHPERYEYVYDDFALLEQLAERGVLLQININSLTGYYGKMAQKTAEKLIDLKMVSFVGSDCHGQRHIRAMQELKAKKYYYKLKDLELKNNQL